MNASSFMLGPGVLVTYEGEIVRVVELTGTEVTARLERTGRYVTASLAHFASGCSAVETEAAAPSFNVGTALAMLTPKEREQVEERAFHVHQMLTGPGTAKENEAAKAAELGKDPRTLRRWARRYRESGEAGLIDSRTTPIRGRRVDHRWDEAFHLVRGRYIDASTPNYTALRAEVEALLDEQSKPGEVPRPSRATAFRRMAELSKGTNAVSGSAAGRRSIAERPEGVYGRLRATRPGEILVLDTQDLDVFALEPVTCRWIGVQLTIAQDLYSRCIVGMRVTVSTKSVDVASVLFEAVAGRTAPESWPEEAVWPFHGLPSRIVLDQGDRSAGPICAPESLVIDNGKVFISAHVKSVCNRLGISVQPAQPYKPTDKPTIERFFRTLREGLIQHIPAYKGSDVHSRGKAVEDQALFYIHEIEDLIREWVATVYHRGKHRGLCIPELPDQKLSPAEMFAIGVGKAGRLRLPATPDLAMDFLPVAARTIQHYGIEVGGRRYNGAPLDPYRNTKSPFGGALAGKWPIRFNPDDVRWVWFEDPEDGRFHPLEWEHAAMLGTAFSAEAAAHARRIALAQSGKVTPEKALADLLKRWSTGLVVDRRERRMVARLGAEYAALPLEEPAPPPTNRTEVLEEVVLSDEDDDDDIDEGFYDDAFEVSR